ncbi:Methyltransferase type 11 [Alkalidesulfovibrio alkalitolerans DSM 16529]|uniref:Methyltransferase type 11 n=2 Tax=Alkalidesulfovibrio alkalitolerans TaxID=293256 RepID=S7UQ15_9BACT|nr:Methyltransferase type 11 [Alkalidesulfovibrio alkalitolerans DSM 16529]
MVKSARQRYTSPENARDPEHDFAMQHDDAFAARYDAWFATPEGKVAFEREKALLADLVSAWPRRGQRLLEIGCGTGMFLECFYEWGFDVDGVDPSAAMLKGARARMGKRADLRLGHAEHLPMDDKEYDYVTLITALEFCEDPEAAMREAVRVARKGVLVGFLNRRSFYALSTRCSCLCGDKGHVSSMRAARWFSLRDVVRLFANAAGKKPRRARSVLPGPPATWREGLPFRLLNHPLYPGWLGGFCAVRFDLVGDKPLTPLAAFTTEASPSGGSA